MERISSRRRRVRAAVQPCCYVDGVRAAVPWRIYHGPRVPPCALALSLSLAATGAAPALPEPAPAPNWRVPVAHAGGLLVGMRLSLVLLWPDAYDPTRFGEERRQLRVAYTRPPELRRGRSLLESDGDPAWLNGIGHGLFGSEVYGRTRQCGHGALAAFLTTAAASVAWEYGIEALHKRPSAIDLVWTPVVGGALGEARFRLHRWLRSRGSAPWLLFAVDPLGEGERRIGRSGC
jgi:hypothetical protein